MAIHWGSWSSNNRLRCGLELSQSPASVDANDTTVKITAKVYVQTRYASWEDNDYSGASNNWYISGGLSASGHTSWNLGAMGVKLMGSVSKTISTSTTSSITTSVTGKIVSRGAYPGTSCSTTTSITTAKRPTAPAPTQTDPEPLPPPPPGEGGWCLYTETDPAPAPGQPMTLTAQWQPVGFTFSGQATIARWSWGNLTIDGDGNIRAFGVLVATGDQAGIVPGGQYRFTASYNPVRNPKIIVTINNDVYTSNTASVPDYEDDVFMVGGRYHPLDYSYNDAAGGRFSHCAYWDRALSQTEMLSLNSDNLCRPGMTASDRMNVILDYIGWPSAARDIDPGISTLNRESWSSPTSVMDLMQGWAGSDSGLLYVDGLGKVVFRNRHARINETVGATLDFQGETAPEAGLSFVMDENDIRNTVNLDVKYGVKGVVRDEASIAQYGEKPFDITLDIQNSNVGMDAAQSALNRYAQPIIRIDGLSINPTASQSDALWTIALNVEIGQLIELTGLPPHAPADTMKFFIESIDHDITKQGDRLVWLTTFSVSPFFEKSGLVLNSPTLGKLDAPTSVLSY